LAVPDVFLHIWAYFIEEVIVGIVNPVISRPRIEITSLTFICEILLD
jgi:hypothetical protein